MSCHLTNNAYCEPVYFETEDQWLTQRNKGIGGSDIAAIAGVDPWRTPYEVFLDKTGQAQYKEPNDAMMLGQKLEPVVAEMFQDRNNNYIVLQKENVLYVSKKNPFAVASLDRLIETENNNKMILEIKTTSEKNHHRWANGVPDHVMLQVQHYMMVTGISEAIVALLIGGRQYLEFEIQKDTELVDQIIEVEETFWHNVKNMIAPCSATNTTSEEFNRIKSYIPDKSKYLLDSLNEEIKLYININERLKMLQIQSEAIERKLKDFLDDAEFAKNNNYFVKWTHYKKQFDKEALIKENPDLLKDPDLCIMDIDWDKVKESSDAVLYEAYNNAKEEVTSLYNTVKSNPNYLKCVDIDRAKLKKKNKALEAKYMKPGLRSKFVIEKI